MANKLGLTPRARFHSFSVAGDDPVFMLTAPIPATQKVLARAGLSIDDIDVMCRDNDALEGSIIVEVSYRVRSTNNRYNHVYPFFMTEGSEGGETI